MTLKKQISLGAFLVCLLLSIQANSQVLLGLIFGDKLNSQESIFGIHVDYSWNCMSGLSNSDNLNSLNLGLFYNYKFNEQFRGMVELMAKYKRGVSGLPVYDLEDANLNELFAEGSISREINYFSIPLVVQYVTTPGIFIELGPQISMRIKAKDIITAEHDEGDLELEKDIKDEVTTFDFGWLAGLGYYIDGSKTIAVGLRYYGGFSDALKIDGTQNHNQWAVYTNLPIGRKKLKLDSNPK